MTIRKPQVFYSFHFDNDVFRVQQIRNLGVIEGNEPVSPNDWESVRRSPGGIERWIDQNMKHKTHVVVLIGSETSQRYWVRHEIAKGWDDGKALLGIYIHNLRDPRFSRNPPYFGGCAQGQNPFARVELQNGATLDQIVPCFNPAPANAYADISASLLDWMARAPRRT